MSSVVIIDQQPVSQVGTAAELERAGHTVVARASNGVEGLDAVRQAHPDLVVLDLDIPRLGGLDVIRRLTSRQRDARTLVFTAFPADIYEHLCVAAGALGFVSKHEPLSTLADAVAKVLSGKTYFSANALQLDDAAGGADGSVIERLTAREITVLHYLADGMRIKDIAGEMAISDRTVSTYKTRLLEKTNTRSLVELLRVTAQRGLVAAPADGAALALGEGSVDQQFNALFDHIPYPICLRNADSRVLAANRAMFDYLEITASDLLGSRPVDIGLVELEHYEYARKTFEAAVEKRIPYMMVIAIQVQGERRVIKHSGVPVLGDDGTFLGMLCTSVDIGEQQQELDSLREQLAYAQAMRQRRSQYLIEHGQAMAGSLASLKAIIDAPPLAVMLMEQLQESVELLTELVQLEQGLVSTTPYVADLNRLTLDVLEKAPGELLPEWDFFPDAHKCWGWVDAERYAQLLRTLLLHSRSLGVTRVDLHANSREPDLGQALWELRLVGALTAPPSSVLPSARWLLAEQLARLLNGQLELTQGPDQSLQARLTLRMPRASQPH